MTRPEDEELASAEGARREDPEGREPGEGGVEERKGSFPEMDREELVDRFLRLRAEFDNYRKRVAREREAQTERALERFALSLLPVVDGLERAVELDVDEAVEGYRQGIRQIYAQLLGLLELEGIEEVAGVGAVFDPQLHEAVGTVESEEIEAGRIAEVSQKGWTLKGRLLRPAKVLVAS